MRLRKTREGGLSGSGRRHNFGQTPEIGPVVSERWELSREEDLDWGPKKRLSRMAVLQDFPYK